MYKRQALADGNEVISGFSALGNKKIAALIVEAREEPLGAHTFLQANGEVKDTRCMRKCARYIVKHATATAVVQEHKTQVAGRECLGEGDNPFREIVAAGEAVSSNNNQVGLCAGRGLDKGDGHRIYSGVGISVEFEDVVWAKVDGDGIREGRIPEVYD